MAETKRHIGQQENLYPEIFDLRAMPKQPEEKKPGQLPDSMIRQFFEEEKKRKERQRKWWVRPWIQRRREHGAYYALMQEMAADDGESYHNFVRMDHHHFELLLSRIEPHIRRQNTNMRECISPGERLAVTLRFLATGDSYHSLSFLYRLGRTSVGKIIPETCKAITAVLRDQYLKGYVIVDSFFQKEELDACRLAIETLVDDLAQMLYQGGKIKNLYKEYGLFQRLTYIEKEFPGANILLHKQGQLPQAFRDLWSSPRILNVVEQMIGPDIMGHPVWNLRTKTPQNEATTVPWHQDSAYLDNRSYEVLQVTAWIPLLDAKRENGCMEVAARGHHKGKVATHQCCWGGTWYVMLDEQEMEDTLEVQPTQRQKTYMNQAAYKMWIYYKGGDIYYKLFASIQEGVDMKRDVVLCAVPYGGMLLLNNMVPHRSLANVTNDIRWSLDLRWQSPEKSVGFYDLKQGILMRTKDNPNMTVNWEDFNKVDRHAEAKEKVNEAFPQDEVDEEFDTTIQGPWMFKWEMIHMNRHTEKLKNEETTWHKS